MEILHVNCWTTSIWSINSMNASVCLACQSNTPRVLQYPKKNNNYIRKSLGDLLKVSYI